MDPFPTVTDSVPGTFFDPVNYVGAEPGGTNWLAGSYRLGPLLSRRHPRMPTTLRAIQSGGQRRRWFLYLRTCSGRTHEEAANYDPNAVRDTAVLRICRKPNCATTWMGTAHGRERPARSPVPLRCSLRLNPFSAPELRTASFRRARTDAEGGMVRPEPVGQQSELTHHGPRQWAWRTT